MDLFVYIILAVVFVIFVMTPIVLTFGFVFMVWLARGGLSLVFMPDNEWDDDEISTPTPQG